MDVVAEAKARWPRHTWRDDDLDGLQIRYAALLLDIADHKAAHRFNQSDADRRLWSVLEREAF